MTKEIEIIGEAESGEAAVEQVRRDAPDVVPHGPSDARDRRSRGDAPDPADQR